MPAGGGIAGGAGRRANEPAHLIDGVPGLRGRVSIFRGLVRDLSEAADVER
jgi:hypothetical protein